MNPRIRKRTAARRRAAHTEWPLWKRGKTRTLDTCHYWAQRDGATGAW